MRALNFKKFSDLITTKPVYDEASEKEKNKRERDLFFSVVCDKSSLKECENLSIDNLLYMLSAAPGYIGGYDEFSQMRSTIIGDFSKLQRITKRRLL